MGTLGSATVRAQSVEAAAPVAAQQPAWALVQEDAPAPRVAVFTRRLRVHAGVFAAGIAMFAGSLGTALGNTRYIDSTPSMTRRANRGWRSLMLSSVPLALGLGGILSAAFRRRRARCASRSSTWGALVYPGAGRVDVAFAF